MSQSNEELAEQLKGLLGQTGLGVALDGGQTEEPANENPLETDFFKAINAFRAARNSGDAEKIAEAERNLQGVVRSELTGESCQEN